MKKIFILILVILIQACAFTDAKLDISHNRDASFKGPIGDIESIKFITANLEDKREDKERIGWKKNGYGAKTADVLSNEPVSLLVSDALTTGLTKNNHTVGENGEITVTGSVDKFWFDFDMNFWTIEFMGDVQCTLIFTETSSGKEVYKSTYKGAYSEKKGGGLNKTWEDVMGKTLDKLIEDIIFDEDLSEALESR